MPFSFLSLKTLLYYLSFDVENEKSYHSLILFLNRQSVFSLFSGWKHKIF